MANYWILAPGHSSVVCGWMAMDSPISHMLQCFKEKCETDFFVKSSVLSVLDIKS